MTPQEMLAKLSEFGQDAGNSSPDGLGHFGWSVDTEHPETGALRITWTPFVKDNRGFSVEGEGQAATWDLRLVSAID